MATNLTYIPNGSLLPYPGIEKSTVHQAELAKLARFRKQAWIQLDSATIKTRHQLKIVELHFKASETAASIQGNLRNVYDKGETSFNQFYLIAQSHTDALFYNITDYIQRCIASDLSVSERLRGRTLLYIYQSEENADDLLNDSGVNAFIKRVLRSYVESYGADAVIGFAVELPSFLSVFEADDTSVPWSDTLLEQIREDNYENNHRTSTNTRGSFLPFLFCETYDSSVIRSVFWQELTSQFAQCFLDGVKIFCHQHNLKLAVTLRESVRSLQYELGTLLEQVDCSILIASESDTPRQFVVAKSVCSSTQHAGIFRKETRTFSQYLSDATFGFNHWISNRVKESHSETHQNESIAELLQVGHPKRPILMLSPTQSLWMKPEEKQWNSITKAWGWLCQTVWNMGYDFDIVSEAQLSDATVEKKEGAICSNGKKYRLVLLPSCLSLHETTVQRLTEFLKAKGRFIVNAPIPYLLNGRVGLEPYLLERLIYKYRTTILDGPQGERETDLRKFLSKWITPAISVYIGQENQLTEVVQVHHRAHENYQLFYLFNTSEKQIETLVEITDEAEAVEERLLQTGKQVLLNSWHANGKTYLNCTFDPRQGRLLVIF